MSPIYPTPTGNLTPQLQAMQGKLPVVKPGTGTDPIKGSMTTPKPSTPTPTVPVQPTQPQTSPFALAQVMSTLQSKVQSNNALMTQRNLLLKQLYNTPLNDQEKSQLDPTMLGAINSNDRNQIDIRLRLISDEVAGRTNTLDSSVKFLTESYNDTIQQAEKQRQDAISNVLDFATVYGSQARTALTSLYGPEYVEQLKGMGVDLDRFSGVKTLEQIKKEREDITPNMTGLDISSPTYIEDLMASTKGGKKPNQVETIRPLQKATTVMSQLSELSSLISNTKTDPILGTIRSMNPYDFDVRAIQSTLQATVPNLARGVYGEVGVLTDNDIKNYINTLPNIKGTEKQNKFVMAMTMRSLMRGFESQLEVLGAAGYDISGFSNVYERMKSTANNIDKELGIGTKQSGNTTVMIGPDGKKWNVPKDKVSIFKSNGYK